MRQRVKRTIGDLLRLYDRAAADVEKANEVLTLVLNRVYGHDKDEPPGDLPFAKLRSYRWMWHHAVDGDGIILTSFGYSEHVNSAGRAYWSRSWCSFVKSSLTGKDTIQTVLGRTPHGAMDELAAAGELAEVMSTNDPVLSMEFRRKLRRWNFALQRRTLVHGKIAQTVTHYLGTEFNWTMGGHSAWRKVEIGDGRILTVTGEGDVIFGDAIKVTHMPEATEAMVRPAPYTTGLAERQRRAKEKLHGM